MKQIKKLLAGLLSAALLASLAPLALAAPAERHLTDILKELYALETGGGSAEVVLLDETGPEWTYQEETDTTNQAQVTTGEATVENGTASVPVYVTAPAGLNGVEVKIIYGEGLTYQGAENNESFATADVRTAGDNTLSLVFANGANVTENADNLLLTTLQFTVADGVTPGAVTPVIDEDTFVTYRGVDDAVNLVKTVVVYGTVTTEKGPTPINVSVSNNTGTTTAATIAAPEGGWVEGENTFTVSADVACVAAVKNADGTYTRLTAAATDVEGTYSFTAELTEGSEIVVAVKGDVNGNGKVDNVDALQLQAAFLNNLTLSDLNAIIGDVNANGKVDNVDALQLQAVYLNNLTFAW